MLKASTAFQAAVVGDARRMMLKAIIDISDPDLVFGSTASSGAAPISHTEEIHDKVFYLDGPEHVTLELNRWVLDGSAPLFPADLAVKGQMGFVSTALAGVDGGFSPAPWVELRFANVRILQMCSVFFPDSDIDGYPVDFTVEVLQGGTAYFTERVTDNEERSRTFKGFTVYNPDAIRVTVHRWSLPLRRMRVVEIIPGLYEDWDSGIIAGFQATMQGSFSNLALPYGTVTLSMDNADRRFEPRSKDGMFQSIEDRQGIDISIGAQLEDGTVEYHRVGLFYQFSGGWRTGDNGLTMQWNLVDVIGLLVDRIFIPPEVLPTTLGGWLNALVSQLGFNFEGRYHADPDYHDLPVTLAENSAENEMTCGDILRYICMATGTWPRADAGTGKLTAEPFWNQGNELTLDNLNAYPVMKANADLALIRFTLSDGTEFIVSGNSTSSSNTVSVSNPFLHTKEQALTAARMILATYGGNQMETVGRGNPTSEIGDVDTVWLNESSATTGRRQFQTFQIQDGVLQGCQSVLLQADGSFMFQNRAVITKSGSWTAPAGVSVLRVIIGQGGTGGGAGGNGVMTTLPSDYSTGSTDLPQPPAGVDGQGGKIWAGTININPQQVFVVTIGRGGAGATEPEGLGSPGGESYFGAYSSDFGEVFSLGYTDVASGDSYGRTGVVSPLSGSGDGGKGGEAGANGVQEFSHLTYHYDDEGNVVGWHTNWNTISPIEDGKPGADGGSGFVVIYWDKEDENG